MGCCQHATPPTGMNGANSNSPRVSNKSDKSSPRHHPIPDGASSNSTSSSAAAANKNPPATSEQPLADMDGDSDDQDGLDGYDALDLSAFQEEVAEFVEFWHKHYDALCRGAIHNALVHRIHDKLKEQYRGFPRETVDEFIKVLPELLEALEALVNMAVDGDMHDAVSVYKDFQPLLLSANSRYTSMESRKPHKVRVRNKQDSISLKLTPPFLDGDDEASTEKPPQIVVTRPMGDDVNTGTTPDPLPSPNPLLLTHSSNDSGLEFISEERADQPAHHASDRSDEAEADAYAFLVGGLSDRVSVDEEEASAHSSLEMETDKTPVGTAHHHHQQHHHQSKHSMASFNKLPQTDDSFETDNGEETSLHRPQDSLRSELENVADVETRLVGVMRMLWFDRVQRSLDKTFSSSSSTMDDVFFILSNALETAIGTFREYKSMMESFTLYSRQGLRTTLEVIRVIVHDLPLHQVQERAAEMYDDPFSFLIQFADRCEIACDFWNEHIATLHRDTKTKLSMRVYSYAIMHVAHDAYETMKANGSAARWSALLLEFMGTIMNFFGRNRHQDLVEYLIMLAAHHEKMRVPSTLLASMGEWLDEVFSAHFDEATYNVERSDAIQFVFAFVGEVMSGAYETPILDTHTQAQRAAVRASSLADGDGDGDEDASLTANYSPGDEQQQQHGRHPYDSSAEYFQIPLSFKSVAAISTEQHDDAYEFQIGHDYNDSTNTAFTTPYTQPSNMNGGGHLAQPSYTLNAAAVVKFSNTLEPRSTTAAQNLRITSLDLNAHPSLTDMLGDRDGDVSQVAGLQPLKHGISAPPTTVRFEQPTPPHDDDVTDHGRKKGTKKVKASVTFENTGLNVMYIANSPLSRLDSPSHSSQSAADQKESEEMMAPPTKVGVPAMDTLHVANAEHRASGSTGSSNRPRQKRSFSSVDNSSAMSKFLAPTPSAHNYTHATHSQQQGQSPGRTKSASTANKKKQSPGAMNTRARRTSSRILLDKQQEKTWKPMHFLQKIMDLEGRKIIANYAFAPSDGSFSGKVVDLTVFHSYFETAEQFWSRVIDVDDKSRNALNDKLLDVFSSRIGDAVRAKVSELFAEKQINFVSMFSAYFRLVRQYLDKCKTMAPTTTMVAPALVHHATANSALPPAIVQTLKSQAVTPSTKTRGTAHMRQQRSSVSIGINRLKLRAETARGDVNALKMAAVSARDDLHHSEGQSFVLGILRMGRKHRSHDIEEKTLKLVAKCLVEVIAKKFEELFTEKIKRAFSIALMLGIKFMCVESSKHTHRKYYDKEKRKSQNKRQDKDQDTGTNQNSAKTTPTPTPPPPTHVQTDNIPTGSTFIKRAQSAATIHQSLAFKK